MDIRFKQILLIAWLIISPIIVLGTDYYVASTDLNVRSGAGKEYSIVYTLQKGDEVEVLYKNGEWYKIKHLGVIGYAHGRFLVSTSDNYSTIEMYFTVFFLVVGFIGLWLFKRWRFEKRREQRRDYYRNEYLQSDEWQRKRYVVLRRDNWRCVYCGAPATQVHHKRYAKIRIGKEPIDWLVSICKGCHEAQHS